MYKPNIGTPINIEIVKVGKQKLNHKELDSPFIKQKEDLSGKNGGLFIIEHYQENPLYLLNVGMGSLIITYWQKRTDDEIPPYSDTYRNLKIIQSWESSPFKANIPKSTYVSSLYCNLYQMLIHHHEPENSDFIIIHDREKDSYYIRRYNAIYCAGMLEPRCDVMLPQGKDFTVFQDEFIKAILINILRRKREVQVSSLVKNYFPGVADQKVRKLLGEFADYVKISSGWVRNDNLDLKAIFDKLNVTPEKICSYQSMLVGLWRLNQNGVNLLKSAPRLYVQIKKLNGEMTKLIAERIESELLKTPWGKISKIREAHKTGTDIDGQNLSNKQNKPNKETEKNKIGGTVADLRTVPLSRLK